MKTTRLILTLLTFTACSCLADNASPNTSDSTWSGVATNAEGKTLASITTGRKSLVTLVNPLMGTDFTGGFSHGNEYPAIALPFPMNSWAPYTQPQRDSFFYQYRRDKIRGIRQTHQPSP